MGKATLYYNPRCSKSRGALELLEARNIDLTIIEYLDTPLDRDALVAVIVASDSRPAEFVRTGDQGRSKTTRSGR
jgi:arsenate reductase